MQKVKLAVLGASGVGKSAMVVRYITGRFLHHYDPTLEDEYCIETDVDGQTVNVSILDTAGLGENSSDCSNYLSLVDAVLVVFSLENQSSLTIAQELLKKTSSLPTVLIGTKCDLRSNERILSYDDALDIANTANCSYLETSSAVNINIFEAFRSVISTVIVQQRPALEEGSLEATKVDKKNSTRSKVRSIWSRLTRFRRDKKLLDSLAVSYDSTIEVEVSSTHQR